MLSDPTTHHPSLFLEVESLDGSQLMHFAAHEGITAANDYNKLWYYYGTVANGVSYGRPIPRSFVWLLILPDRPVEPCPGFTIWDSTPAYGFFGPSLNRVVCDNPYRFYDHLIKAEAALFIMRQHELKDSQTSSWTRRSLLDLQSECELAFITCTGVELILSRGRDRFHPQAEIRTRIRWR